MKISIECSNCWSKIVHTLPYEDEVCLQDFYCERWICSKCKYETILGYNESIATKVKSNDISQKAPIRLHRGTRRELKISDITDSGKWDIGYGYSVIIENYNFERDEMVLIIGFEDDNGKMHLFDYSEFRDTRISRNAISEISTLRVPAGWAVNDSGFDQTRPVIMVKDITSIIWLQFDGVIWKRKLQDPVLIKSCFSCEKEYTGDVKNWKTSRGFWLYHPDYKWEGSRKSLLLCGDCIDSSWAICKCGSFIRDVEKIDYYPENYSGPIICPTCARYWEP